MPPNHRETRIYLIIWLVGAGISKNILKMISNDLQADKNGSRIFFVLSITILLLELSTTNCQQVCDKTSDVLECYFCSNTVTNKRCSDENGNSLTNNWSVLKSPPGQDISSYRWELKVCL